MKKKFHNKKASSIFFIKAVVFLFLSFFISNQYSKAQCVNIFPHVDDFETAATWTAYTAPTSSVAGTSDWAWGSPNHTYVIHSAGSGNKCWSVGSLTGAFYNFNQQSYVQSPCYNFTSLQYPHVKFKLFYDSENIYDGGNLQSSIDGGVSWQDIGTTGETTDCNTAYWYNYASITYLNKPTGFVTSKHGWCGNVEAGGTGWDATHAGTSCAGGNGIGHWVTAEHCLTGLAGKPNVLLRFTFGAGYSCNNFDGLAFDSVAVSNGIINATTITTTCGTGNTLNFNSGAKACPTNTWAWNFGDASSGTSNTSASQNPSHTFSAPGIYTVSVIASGGVCNPPDTAIKIVHIMNASITSFSNANCASLGSATVAVVASTAPVYSWLPSGGSTSIATGLTAGNYSVSITDPNACPTMTTVTIAQTNSPNVSAVASAANCLTPGSATATPSGGTAPYTYLWLPSGGTSSTATGLTAGNYTVTITDVNTCTATANVTVSNTGGVTASATSASVTCHAGTNGSSTVTPTGGTGPYTYTWSPSGGNSIIATNLTAGNYTVSVSDAHSCTTTAIANIVQPSIISLTSITTSVICNGGSTGSSSVSATGGTPGYTYTWSPSGGSLSSVNGLDAGNYTVSVLDNNSCAASTSLTINQPSPITANPTSSPATCGQANGTANVIVSGGTSGYTYTWSPSGGNSNSATGLSGGAYTVTIKDANNCLSTAQTNVVQTPSISLNVIGISASCGNANGTATATATGGTGVITYTWSSGGNSSIATNLAGNTAYTISASDAVGCSVSKNITIGNHPAPILSVASNSITCNGLADGTASVNVNSNTGTAPFTYSWMPIGGSNAVVNNLVAGNYTVLVTDSSNCVASSTITINQPPAINATISNTSATCGQANGTATVTSTNGGNPGYTYLWSPMGGNSTSASGLTAGNYTVTIKDATNCTYTAQTTVTSNSSINLSLSSTPAKCGINNGSVTANASGGLPSQNGYIYTWNPSVSSNNLATGLNSGIFNVSVSDSLGCVITKAITVGNKIAPTLSVLSNNVACFGASTGGATVNINAGTGTAPYIYAWSPSGGGNSLANNLSVGNYTVTVTDSAGCIANKTVSITQPPALTVTPTATLATCGNANGITNCNVTGGTPGYTYTWMPSGGNSSAANNLPGNITYTVLVNDSNNCLQAASILVNQTSAVTLQVSSTTSVTCFGLNDGSASVTASGGTPSSTYSWIPSGGSNSIGSNLSAGLYTVSVQDNNLCNTTTTLSIVQPPIINVSVNNQSICSGQTTSLTATVSGGNGSAVSYTWSPTNASTQQINVNPAATSSYVVSVQNTGCSQTAQASGIVNVYPAIYISVTPADTICKGGQQTLSANASGGSGGIFTYNWNCGQNTPNIVVHPNVSTSYTVTAHDALCPAVTATTQVNIYNNPNLTISSTPTSGCGSVCVSFTAGISANVAGNYIVPPYNWNFGDGVTSNGANVGHCYNKTGNYDVTLIAVTQNQCIDTIKKVNFIHVHQNPIADFSASTFETDVDNGTIHFYNQSSPNVINWNWNTDTTSYTMQNPSHTYFNDGIYPVTLIVTDSVGCKDTIVKDIVIKPEYTFYAPNCFTPNGDGKNESFLPIGTGWDDNNYNLWIFDRWGNMFFHTSNPIQGWDGTRYNEAVQEDTYVWKVVLKDVFQKEHEYHGQISVVR